MADNFVWYELVTSDEDAAQAFYKAVIGWDAQPFKAAEDAPDYRVLSMAGKGVGGLMPLPEGVSHPFWMGYVGVADFDAAVAKATAAGATIHRTMDIPTVGKIALLSDPQGVGYAMIQGYSGQKSEAFNQALPGHGNWNELHSPDPVAAFDYYAGQYGWTKGQTMPMGPMGDYQLFQADGADIGGMMPVQNGMKPTWLFYFGVPDIDEAVERIKANGGTVLNGPMEVPGPVFIVQFTDPQGATVAVVGPRK
jgi:predicted enzyme related to lactoylglutathione lyase